MKRTYVGFGFGAIQAGLLVYEAYRSGGFTRLVVAEVMPVVDAVRRNGGRYGLNIATPDGIEQVTVEGIEIFNPRVPADREALVAAVAEAAEAGTALPSVRFYGQGAADDVVGILRAGLARKAQAGGPPLVVYTAENHNHAAEILGEALAGGGKAAEAPATLVRVLNTVVGKMSGVVTDPAQVAEQGLLPLTPGSARAFLVERFNRILVTQVGDARFDRAITVFEEKPDLLPFEEAKLFGHNATHALIGYLGAGKGYRWMAEAGADAEIGAVARAAFLDESGGALCRKYAGLDPLFTPDGYRAYVEDLLVRMVNPHLRDTVERITRDPRRKLGWNDRLIGTMRLVLSQGLEPRGYARGAAAAVRLLAAEEGRELPAVLESLREEAGVDADAWEPVAARLG
jgi:mannitol-1-phosphate 5-dehydrogenase